MQQVKNLLNELKLYGMFHAIDSVANHASQESMSFSEAFLLILQEESQYRIAKKSMALQKKAAFRNNASLENWDGTFDRGLSRQQLRELAGLHFYNKKQNLILVGQTGVGKTQLSIALGRVACHNSIGVSFLSTNRFFEEYNVAQSTGKTIQWIKNLSKIPILILDDFALRHYTHQEATILLEVIEERFQKGSMIITSQIDPSGWNVLFDDPAMVDAILDRLQNPAQKIVLTGPSYRAQLGREQIGATGQGGQKE